jgi:hypothetical protein
MGAVAAAGAVFAAGGVAALVRRAGEMDAHLLAEAEAKGKKAAEDNFKANIERRTQEHHEARSADATQALEFQAKMKEALGEEYLQAWNVPDIAVAYRFVRKAQIGGRWDGVATLLDRMDEAGEMIRKALSDIGIDPPSKKRRG